MEKDIRPVRDSPNNPFLVALPVDAAADSDAESDVEVPSSPLGPKTPLPELPTSRPDFATQQAQSLWRPPMRRSQTSSDSIPLPLRTPTIALPPLGFSTVGQSALETPGGVRGSYF